MCVQAFCPRLAVEGFDEAVVSRLSGTGEVERGIVGIGPQIEIPRDELTAVVDLDHSRIPDLAADAFERLNDVLAAVREPRIGCRAVARVSTTVGMRRFGSMAS